MLDERDHRPRRDHGEACAELLLEAGRQFDPAVVDALLEELASPSPPAPAPILETIEPDEITAAEVAARLQEMLAGLSVPEPPPPRGRPGDR
jgi:hypothetical protein